MNLALVYCLHGNEKYGLDVAYKFSPHIFSLFGNKRAYKQNKRFIESDLNRCFPGNKEGNYEEKLAYTLFNKLKKFYYTIDLHSSSNDCPLFGIITKPSKEKIKFAKKLGLGKLVIMPKSFASGKALIDFVKCGISLEIGPHERSKNVDDVSKAIENFLLDKNYNDDLEILEVFKTIKKKYDSVLIKNFDKVKKGQVITYFNRKEQIAECDFTAVLVGEESYGNTLCLAARKVNLKVGGD